VVYFLCLKNVVAATRLFALRICNRSVPERLTRKNAYVAWYIRVAIVV